jgi:hypothetical protein
MLQSYEMAKLSEPIHHKKYAIGIVRLWETLKKIHSDNSPRLYRNRQGLQ